MALWVLYLFVLGGITGFEALFLMPTRPPLFFAIYGSVLASGVTLCGWFIKPGPLRGWAAVVSIALLVVSVCLLFAGN